MSRYSAVTILLWIASISGSILVAFQLRRASSIALRSLRTSLLLHAAASLAGLGCVMFGSPWAYYREYLFGEVINLFGQCILLTGVWRSLYPRVKASRFRIAGIALIALTAMLSAADFAGGIPDHSIRTIILLTHAIGYTCCASIFAMTMYAWVTGCAWTAAAARCMIGYAIMVGATFGIEQTEALVGWNHWYLYHAPSVFYLVALSIWNSAISLDQPKQLTSAELASLERQLTDALEIGPGVTCE